MSKTEQNGNAPVTVESLTEQVTELTGRLEIAEEIETSMKADNERLTAENASLKEENASLKKGGPAAAGATQTSVPDYYSGKVKGTYLAADKPQLDPTGTLRFEVTGGLRNNVVGPVRAGSWLDMQLKAGTIKFSVDQ